MTKDEIRLATAEEADNLLERLRRWVLLPNAEAIAPIIERGDIAGVVFNPTDPDLARSWGWDGATPVFRISSGVRKRVVRRFREMGDKVSERWFDGKRNGRVFVLFEAGSFLVNITDEEWGIEPGSLDAERAT